MKITKNGVFSNILWRFAERCGAQGVSLIVSIVLARLLAPEVYGTVALVTVFTTILQVFVDGGLGTALIQKKDADHLDFSSVFYFNIIMCTVLYVGMYIASPYIANFYNDPDLVPVIRCLSLTLVISGVKNVQQSYVSCTMQFKRFFFATLGGTIGAAIIGITMAYYGYGVWALVAQQLFNTTVDTIILWITVKWRPKKEFSFTRLKSLFAFGWKMLTSGLLDRVYTELRQLIIGKFYTKADLAYYNRGQQFPNLIVNNINTSIDSVLLPTLANAQEDSQRVKEMTRRSIKVSTFVMAPLMVGLSVVAEPLVRLVLTEKWLPCVLFLRIICITYMFYPIHTANLNAIKALGRSDMFLKLEIAKKAVGLVALVITMQISVEAMAYSLLVTSFLNQIINSWPNKTLLNYRYVEQMMDILPSIFISVLMGAIIYPITFLGFPDFVTLMVQVLVGMGVYVAASMVLKIDSFVYLLNIVKGMMKKR